MNTLDEIGEQLVCITYNTGDMIWLYRNDEGNLVVIKIIDDAGIEYRYDDSGNLLSKIRL